jgi:hypothetical protein
LKKDYDTAAIYLGLFIFATLDFAINYFLGPLRCKDGWVSYSIGRRGACSHHGGVENRSWVFYFSAIVGFFSAMYYSSRNKS